MEPVRFENVTAIVLAGGISNRMGGLDKSMLPVRSVPLIQHIVSQLEPHFSEIIIGARDGNKYSFLGHRVITDAIKDLGPLMGIYSCLISSGNDLNFITACDIPDIRIDFIRNMLRFSSEADIIVPVKGIDDYEPLHAIYRKSIVPVAGKLLKERRLKISDLFGMVKTKFIPFDGRGWYYNLNNRDDYYNYTGNSG
ncbi:MAG: molybdenum cofactor guanylyltransferase, partial [Bacteroidales bacterium]|nr:molybdenum cofactor guanylyltransferase [Bacteroidales bacterium]